MQSFIDHSSRGDVPASLSREQLNHLRVELEAFLDEQRDRLQRNEELFRALAADSSVGSAERESARPAAERAYAAIQEANRALAQMDDGTYGACLRCDRPIPFERLEALPRTRTCVACPDD